MIPDHRIRKTRHHLWITMAEEEQLNDQLGTSANRFGNGQTQENVFRDLQDAHQNRKDQNNNF